MPNGQWSTTNLNCVAIKPHPRARVSQGETHSQGVVNLEDSQQSKTSPEYQEVAPQRKPMPDHHPIVRHRNTNILRPYIKCPRDTTIMLPKNKKTIYVVLAQPKSNVDWNSHIDANPPWAKNLQAHLGAGVHTITFTARSPNALSISEACVTVITVKSSDLPTAITVPQLRFCPKDIEVQLQPHEQVRAIFWMVPVFQSKQPLKISNSQSPGSRFGVGNHKVTYIATDIHNQNSTCQFSVIVHPPSESTQTRVKPMISIELDI